MTHTRRRSFLADALRAHALLFDAPLAPSYGEDTGRRVLVAFAAVAFGVFALLRGLLDGSAGAGSPAGRASFVLALLGAFVVLQTFWLRAPFGAVGLRRAADWSRVEWLYLAQIAPLAAIAFSTIFRAHLSTLFQAHGAVGFAVAVLTGFLWGMVQESLYRGWLQTELTRRWGWVPGWLVANLVFTFGPLHADAYLRGGVHGGRLLAIFAIGLLFGLLYRRSGNLWIPAVLHGLWPLNMS